MESSPRDFIEGKAIVFFLVTFTFYLAPAISKNNCLILLGISRSDSI